MSDQWELSWENYTKYDDIEPNNETTYFLTLKKNIAKQEEESQIIESLQRKKFDILKIVDVSEPDHYTISYEGKRAARLFEHNQYLILQTSDLVFEEKIFTVIKSLNIINEIIKLPHKEEKITLKDTNITAISRTGLLKNDKINFFPSTFYKFFINDEVIGQMLIEYFNYEMDDCAPTIMMIEVSDYFRGRGYGKLILKEVECILKQSGFKRIWSSDTESEWFWRKMGFHIDIDEAYKSLTRIKC